jgi:hypothetical protein
VVPLKVLYYTAKLTVKTEPKAYPGKDTVISGQFDYGTNPLPAARAVEISLDNQKALSLEVSGDFSTKLALPPDMTEGEHLVTISVAAQERYAPILINTVLNVTKSLPVLSLQVPSFVFIPGSFNISGKLDSDTGPVAQAHITLTFAGKQFEAVSADDGTFKATIANKMGFGLFGSQSMGIYVEPGVPWQSTLTATHKLITIYGINCIIFFALLAVLGIILPRRIKFRKFSSKSAHKLPGETTAVPAPAAVTKTDTAAEFKLADNTPAKNQSDETKALPDKLFFWYRIVIQLVQRVSGVLLKRNQTLREYNRETSKTTGAANRYLLEFTKMIERVLYSPHKVNDEDIKNGEELTHKIQESMRK